MFLVLLDIQNQYPGSACNNIGAKLTTNAFSINNPLTVDNYAQVFESAIILDTINWVEISGSFIADSNYQYLCIGNFFDDFNTNVAPIISAYNDAYYYLDDIILSSDSNFVNYTFSVNTLTTIQIFPNPVSNRLIIKADNICIAELFNSMGSKVCCKVELNSIDNEYYILNLSELTSGVYILVLKLSNDSTYSKRIIITNN